MKVIILGAGGRGNVYAKYFSENGVEIAGLADPNTERLHKVANSNGIPEASLYHSWEEVLEKPKFADAVVNATTDHLHYPYSGVSSVPALPGPGPSPSFGGGIVPVAMSLCQ